MELTSKQRAQLRGLANTIDTILQVGKDGIGENLIKQAGDALEVQVGQGRLAGEQAALPLRDIAAEGELIKGAVGQGLRLALRDTEGQGGAVIV